MQAGASATALKVPASQGSHTRFEDAVPAFAACSPGAHAVQASHREELFMVLKVPAAHSSQARSRVVVPSLSTHWPAAQVSLGAHRVPGSVSWS